MPVADIDALVAPGPTFRPPLPAGRWEGVPILGFCGLAGAGKTTAADYFCAIHGFTRVRFAGPLKAMLRAFGLSDAEVDGADKERPSTLLGGKTPRQAMQWLGTEWGRTLVDPDIWLRAWAHQVDCLFEAGRPVVIDDVRFPNEAQAIWARGGQVIRVINQAQPPSPPRHISETIGFSWNNEVVNPGDSLSGFHTALRALSSCANSPEIIPRTVSKTT